MLIYQGLDYTNPAGQGFISELAASQGLSTANLVVKPCFGASLFRSSGIGSFEYNMSQITNLSYTGEAQTGATNYFCFGSLFSKIFVGGFTGAGYYDALLQVPNQYPIIVERRNATADDLLIDQSREYIYNGIAFAKLVVQNSANNTVDWSFNFTGVIVTT